MCVRHTYIASTGGIEVFAGIYRAFRKEWCKSKVNLFANDEKRIKKFIILTSCVSLHKKKTFTSRTNS